MAFSGGTFSRTFDCTTDRDNGVKILASKFDTELDGMATGLSTCILKDGTQTCTAAIPFAQGITLPDDKTIAFGTNSDVLIQYDETTTDSLKISAAEGAGLAITLMADEGDDAGDEWKLAIADGGTLTLGNDINSAGTYVTHLTITPNATVANSTMAVAGNLTVGGALTLGSGAVISEAELETIDGITPGTVLASKAMVVDSDKDITGGRNLTITGELDAATLDISGNADIDGTLEADAMTLNGTAITATATLDTGISNNNVPKFTSGAADNDFLRIDGTAIEGRSAAEVLSDIAAAPAAGSSNIVTTGALNSGSITSGFGSIDNGSSAITTTGAVSGGSFVAPDNGKIQLGASQDLEIYHDGSASIVYDNGTGPLNLQTNNSNINIKGGGSASDTMAIFKSTEGVELYYNNAKKFESASFGAQVTGSLAVDTITNASSSTDVTIDTNFDIILDGANVGIGTASPSQKLDVVGSSANIRVAESSGGDLRMNVSGSTGGIGTHSNHALLFRTNSTERMRIDTSGNLLVGGTAAASASSTETCTIGGGGTISTSRLATAARSHHVFYNANGAVGQIQTSGTSTSYLTSSDYRLKDNVNYNWDATTRLKQLKPARFNFIADADTTVDGFLAHEVSHDSDGNPLVPEAITGNKDAMMDEEYEVSAATGDIYTPATDDADEVIHSANVENPDTLEEGQQWRETKEAVMGTRSVPDYQGIDQSKLTPLLTKALIESVAKIEALEARITALEAG